MNTQQTSKTSLEDNIKDIQGRMKEVVARIKYNSEDIEATRSRIEQMEGVPERLQGQYDELREKRQEALALGKSTEKINTALNEVRAELEIKEDELIGLQKRLETLQEEARILEKEKNDIYYAIPKVKLIHLKDEYNRAAERLAQIVIDIQEQRHLLNDSNTGRFVYCPAGFDSGAFHVITKLYLVDEPIPDNAHNNERLFYNVRWFDADRIRQAKEKHDQNFSQ